MGKITDYAKEFNIQSIIYAPVVGHLRIYISSRFLIKRVRLIGWPVTNVKTACPALINILQNK